MADFISMLKNIWRVCISQTLIFQVQSGQDLTTASQNSYDAAVKLPKLKNTEVPELSYSDVIAPESIYRAWVKTVRDMSDNLGITAPSLFINGKYFAWNEVCLHNLIPTILLTIIKLCA